MIRFVSETGSTNADIAAALASGEYWREGDWLVADRQVQGRGRLGRVWSDGAGNFMGSTLVRPAHGDSAAATLALMAGLALRETVSPLLNGADSALLKWPNDLLIDGAKVAGILLEAASDCVIVGIGVNLRSAPELPDRRTTSLAQHGSEIGRDAFAELLATSFTLELQRWRHGGVAPLLRRWQSVAHPVGTRLVVLPPGEEAVAGDFAGLTEDGNLRVRLADGSARTIHAGDVLLQDSSLSGNA